MKLWQRVLGVEAEAWHDINTIDDYLLFSGMAYPLGVQTSMGYSSEEPPPSSFTAYADRVFKAHPVVFGAERIRTAIFSQARFQWRNLNTGNLFGNRELSILNYPWPGGRTVDLLSMMLLHGDIGGNAYVIRPESGRLSLMRPDYVTIILGSNLDPDNPGLAEDASLVGFMYAPPYGSAPRFYGANEVAHFKTMPDPTAHFRGMSWMTPIINDLQADRQATAHKLKFFEQGATPNFALVADASVTIDKLKAFKELIEENSGGLANAYKTLYLGGGMDPKPIGINFKDMDFSELQGKAETRILMAAGVHAVIAGASEGMQGASLNAGNFKQVRRNYSDIDLQSLFLRASGSLENLLTVPKRDGVREAELVVDGRDIPFLQDDQIDQAEIQMKQVSAITAAVRDGFTATSSVAAVVANDMRKLEHTGKTSVQLQEPDAADQSPTTDSEDDQEDSE